MRSEIAAGQLDQTSEVGSLHRFPHQAMSWRNCPTSPGECPPSLGSHWLLQSSLFPPSWRFFVSLHILRIQKCALSSVLCCPVLGQSPLQGPAFAACFATSASCFRKFDFAVVCGSPALASFGKGDCGSVCCVVPHGTCRMNVKSIETAAGTPPDIQVLPSTSKNFQH